MRWRRILQYRSVKRRQIRMNKKLKDALLKIVGIFLGIIFGLAGALFLQWRLEKQMKTRGYVLEQYWRKI